MPKDEAYKAMVMIAETTPMKWLGRSEEIAKAFAFLAFEATYTTGAELPIDDGSSQL